MVGRGGSMTLVLKLFVETEFWILKEVKCVTVDSDAIAHVNACQAMALRTLSRETVLPYALEAVYMALAQLLTLA